MLSKKQLLEIREHLEKAQNPLFFFDNDVDGLCSYVLLRRFIDRGRGVAVKSHPGVDRIYAKKAQELGADYIFVLDRPVLGNEFVEEIKSLGLPIVWVDHHDTEDEGHKYENLFIYNPMKNKIQSNEPTTFLCYKTTERKEDIWIALMGCIADHYLPDFSVEFKDRFPEYWRNYIEDPFDGLYETEIGRLARSLSFGIKDSISHVIKLQNFLINCKNPGELSLDLESNSSFGRKYRSIMKKYNLLYEKAKNNVEEKIIFYNYSGDLSISSDLSNQLDHEFPNRIIAVAYSAGPFTNISLRGNKVKNILDEILPLMTDATGGGHENAVGSRIKSSELDKFKEELFKRVKNEIEK